MKKKRLIIPFVFSLLFIFSCGNDTIPPGFTDSKSQNRPEPANTTTVEQKQISNIYEAVGTIRPLTESVIESQVSAQVIQVLITPGKAVKKDQVLIELDARRLNAQLKQAKEGLEVAKNALVQAQKSMDEAKAGLDQAKAAYDRTQKLFETGIVPSQKLEIDKSAYLQAKARMEKAGEGQASARSAIRQAEEVVKEAAIAMGYAKIKSPADGIVAERLADPGDLAVPGKPLLVIQTSGALRLEANVREGLISRIVMGQSYPVKIQTIEKTVTSTVEEIVPYADPVTRTFMVMASLPDTPGIYPGMFGRLLISVEKADTLLIPADAVRRVGQLEMVNVKSDGTWQSVYIKTGKTVDSKVEVLAGLTGDETIGY